MRATRLLLLSLAPLGALLASCSRGVPDDIAFSGYAEAEYTRVAAPVAGRLVTLAVQRGASVAASAPLFTLEQTLDAADLAAAQARVAKAAATQADIARGQRPEELAVTQAALEAAQAAARRSEGDLARQRELVGRGFASAATLAAMQAQRDADAARVRELQAQLRVAALGARPDARSGAAADVAAARAALAQSQWRLAQTTVLAPAAAQVDDTLYRVGEWVTAGTPVVTLLEPGAVKLRFFVPEPRLARLAPGTRVQVSCDGCGAGLVATVRFVAHAAEFTPPVIYSQGNRERLLFMAEAALAPADAARLRPGLPVEVRLQ